MARFPLLNIYRRYFQGLGCLVIILGFLVATGSAIAVQVGMSGLISYGGYGGYYYVDPLQSFFLRVVLFIGVYLVALLLAFPFLLIAESLKLVQSIEDHLYHLRYPNDSQIVSRRPRTTVEQLIADNETSVIDDAKVLQSGLMNLIHQRTAPASDVSQKPKPEVRATSTNSRVPPRTPRTEPPPPIDSYKTAEVPSVPPEEDSGAAPLISVVGTVDAPDPEPRPREPKPDPSPASPLRSGTTGPLVSTSPLAKAAYQQGMTWGNKAQKSGALSDWEAARDSFLEAIHNDTGLVDAYRKLATVYKKLGDEDNYTYYMTEYNARIDG